jgi:hypothetical protein
MKIKRKGYEGKFDEQIGRMDAQLAFLQASEYSWRMAEPDIEYYKNIESYIAEEERGQG